MSETMLKIQIAPFEHMLRDSRQRLSRFLVRNGALYLVVSADQIAFFESIDGLTCLITDAGQRYWMDATQAVRCLHDTA